jgi:hypothetical protein
VLGHAAFATAPFLSGTMLVGRVVTVTPGKYAPSTATPSYVWLRSGDPIADATGARYRLTPADVGHRISVRVTLTAPHWASATARTVWSPVVKAVPELDVTSRVRGHWVALQFVVHAPGIAGPDGKVVVTEHGVRVGRVDTTGGRGRLVLSRVASGVHHYRFAYIGRLQEPRGGRIEVTVP